jgi:hypothetical protein
LILRLDILASFLELEGYCLAPTTDLMKLVPSDMSTSSPVVNAFALNVEPIEVSGVKKGK